MAVSLDEGRPADTQTDVPGAAEGRQYAKGKAGGQRQQNRACDAEDIQLGPAVRPLLHHGKRRWPMAPGSVRVKVAQELRGVHLVYAREEPYRLYRPVRTTAACQAVPFKDRFYTREAYDRFANGCIRADDQPVIGCWPAHGYSEIPGRPSGLSAYHLMVAGSVVNSPRQSFHS